MPDKNIVDDYYSKISADGSNPDNKDAHQGWKPKIIARKKIIAKKKAPISADTKSEPSANTQTPYKKPVVVQTMKVVQKTDAPAAKRYPSSNNTGNRSGNTPSRPYTPSRPNNASRPATGTGPKPTTWVRPTTGTGNRPATGTRPNTGTRPTSGWYKGNNPRPYGAAQTPSTAWGFQTRGVGGTEKKFFNDKKAGQNSSKPSDKKDPNKGKLNPNDRRSRGRFRGWYEEPNKPLEFTRSNKIAKKEEKNIEDIQQNLVDKKWATVILPEFVTLKELSEKLGVVLPKLMAEFMKNGVMVNINSKIDFDTASLIAEAFDIKLEKDDSAGSNTEDIVSRNIVELMKEDDSSKLSPRAPVISIMGHVDHGKTSLLDYIRKAKVASGEAGWITQSIGAYQVEWENGNITFLDTPGHEAFTIMRARGAKSTDIAILVVAADEGVKPQTIESINHAKEAGIPVIVAINKMDKEGANPDHIKGQLAEHGLTPEDWGGDTPMVPVSAHTGFGIDDLLEIILLVAEMKELKANPNRNGIATVIESHLDIKLGPVATVLVNTGTIHNTDQILCQDSYGKIRILKNYANQSIKKALPGDAILIVGLDKVVNGWDILQVVSSNEIAKQKAAEYKIILEREKSRSASGLDLLMSKIRAWNLKQLKVILKADTNGSLEAIKAALIKLSTPETNVSIIHGWVGR